MKPIIEAFIVTLAAAVCNDTQFGNKTMKESFYFMKQK